MLVTKNPKCDFCGTSLSEVVYHPKHSRRGMEVLVCGSCGLVQSLQGNIEPNRIQTLSTDADWGNVRHGKSVRFDFLKSILIDEIKWGEVKKALDVGSNRGDFVLWLRNFHPAVECWAVEPDSTVVEKYASCVKENLYLDKLENVNLPDGEFDLIFCSHTLEHAASASQMLHSMYKALNSGGYLLLEIPNLEGITDANVIEEFFIDKHTFHFDRETLIDFILSAGFDVLKGINDIDPLNITLLLKKNGDNSLYSPSCGFERSMRNSGWIKKYSSKLVVNRDFLGWIVKEKLTPLAKRQKVGYWGAGRIFDTLIKYGNLQKNNVYCLVDGYLHGILHETHSIKIDKPESLRISEPNVLVVLGRSNEEYMARTAYQYGIRHIVKFSELMEQARDASDI